MFPPASALRSMPSSLPNGSASVEPTPRWPVVGTLMGGLTLTHTHSHSLTFTHIHSLTHSPTSPTSPPTSPTSPTALTHSLTHSLTSLHFTSLTSLALTSLTHTHHTHITHTLTHSLYMNIHTYTQTHPPSPLHHSYTSSSLLAFLWSV